MIDHILLEFLGPTELFCFAFVDDIIELLHVEDIGSPELDVGNNVDEYIWQIGSYTENKSATTNFINTIIMST